MFHFDISGKENNEKQFINIPPMFIALLVSQLDISGKEINEEQS